MCSPAAPGSGSRPGPGGHAAVVRAVRAGPAVVPAGAAPRPGGAGARHVGAARGAERGLDGEEGVSARPPIPASSPGTDFCPAGGAGHQNRTSSSTV